MLLPADDTLDPPQPEERAVVEAYEGGEFNDGMYVVRLWSQYREPGDDGIREIHEDQMEAL